jgi:acyl-CoA thioesterase
MNEHKSDLSAVIEPQAHDDAGRYALDVPAGWGQARGTFGGVLFGAMFRAIEHAEPERDRTLRSFTGEIAGPVVPGPATITVEAIRRGNGVSTWSARLAQGEGTLVTANVVLGRTRDIDRTWSPEPPAATPWREVTAAPRELPFVPEFTKHLEFRPFGTMPFSGGTEPVSTGWIMPRAASRGIGAAEVIALADAWWPAAFSLERAPRPIATVAFTLQCLLGDRVLPADEPLLHRARVVASAQGFFIEMRELWTAAGALVALNQQTFVWIR